MFSGYPLRPACMIRGAGVPERTTKLKDMAKVEIITNNGHLCAVIYERENEFICAEKSSSMGFKTISSALSWLGQVCKGEPFTPDQGCYKMMPEEVKAEVIKQLNA